MTAAEPSQNAADPGAGPASDAAPPAGTQRAGLIFGVVAYLLWGLLPLYFLLLAPASALEIVAWRILWSLVFCALALTVTRGWRVFAGLAVRRRILFTMAAAGVLIFINWQTYVFATTTGHIVEASMGYFINPIVTVFLGVLVLHERLRRLQWLAVAVSLVAVIVLTVAYGAFPWIALTLAFSFGLYGLVKKQVGRQVDALSGLTLETAWLVPVAVAELLIVNAAVPGGVTFAAHGPSHAILLGLAGVVTAVPLLLFAASARRLPLVQIGLIQYLTPVIQFIVGVFVEHEALSWQRWFGFVLIWLSLAVLTVDLVRAGRRFRRIT